MSYIAIRTGNRPNQVKKLAVWGNSSSSMFLDTRRTTIVGVPIGIVVENSWTNEEFAPRVKRRGEEVIDLRQLSAAASTANASIDHMKDWLQGSVDWQAVGLRSNGKIYGVPEGLFFSFPCTTVEGEINPVTNLKMDDEFSAHRFKRTLDDLLEERQIVEEFLG